MEVMREFLMISCRNNISFQWKWNVCVPLLAVLELFRAAGPPKEKNLRLMCRPSWCLAISRHSRLGTLPPLIHQLQWCLRVLCCQKSSQLSGEVFLRAHLAQKKPSQLRNDVYCTVKKIRKYFWLAEDKEARTNIWAVLKIESSSMLAKFKFIWTRSSTTKYPFATPNRSSSSKLFQKIPLKNGWKSTGPAGGFSTIAAIYLTRTSQSTGILQQMLDNKSNSCAITEKIGRRRRSHIFLSCNDCSSNKQSQGWQKNAGKNVLAILVSSSFLKQRVISPPPLIYLFIFPILLLLFLLTQELI